MNPRLDLPLLLWRRGSGRGGRHFGKSLLPLSATAFVPLSPRSAGGAREKPSGAVSSCACNFLCSLCSAGNPCGCCGLRLRRPAAPQRGQGRHDTQAGRCHRADPGSRRKRESGDEAGPGDCESAHLHRTCRLTNGTIRDPRCRSVANRFRVARHSTLNPPPPSFSARRCR
jgi:hypothetical protein